MRPTDSTTDGCAVLLSSLAAPGLVQAHKNACLGRKQEPPLPQDEGIRLATHLTPAAQIFHRGYIAQQHGFEHYVRHRHQVRRVLRLLSSAFLPRGYSGLLAGLNHFHMAEGAASPWQRSETAESFLRTHPSQGAGTKHLVTQRIRATPTSFPAVRQARITEETQQQQPRPIIGGNTQSSVQ